MLKNRQDLAREQMVETRSTVIPKNNEKKAKNTI